MKISSLKTAESESKQQQADAADSDETKYITADNLGEETILNCNKIKEKPSSGDKTKVKGHARKPSMFKEV